MLYPILYKRTATGAIQQWQMEIEFDKYRTISGQKDGKLVTSSWKTAEATNLGKANQRLPNQQAIFEVESSYTKKKESGYTEEIGDIDTSVTFFKPMLAKDYNDHKHKLSYPVYTQSKLDGIRCVITKQGMFSRNGKPIVSCPHILDELKEVFEKYPNLVLDGELYNHELKEDFNTIVSCVKTLLPTKDDLDKSASLIKYYLYDIPSINQKFSDRMEYMEAFRNFSTVVLVDTTEVNSEKEIQSKHDENLENGYEGTMVRTNALYQNKRTSDLLKYKDFLDDEFELIDIIEGQGNWATYAKSATLLLPDGREFSAGICGTQDFCRSVLLDKQKYIGKKTTVNFFNYTPDGIPRFPRVKELDRIDK